MKYLVAFLFTLTNISTINAQSPVGHLLDSLPSNFSYQVTTDSFAKIDFNTSASPITYFQGKMTIGCYKPLEIQPLFSIEIGHSFLFESIEEFNFFINEDNIDNFRLIFYAVQKEHSKKDSLLLQELAEYCTYGQHNYVIQSDDFILFTYMEASDMRLLTYNLEKIGLWNQIEKRLINNLNSGTSFQTKTQKPNSTNTPFHQKDIISGEFLWQSRLPSSKIEISSSATSPTYLKLDKNGKGLVINNYHKKESSQYKYECNWSMDNLYIYIHAKHHQMQVLKIHNENTLIDINQKSSFNRMTN
jgi:hypothetical protein